VILQIHPDQPLKLSLKYRNAYEKTVNGSVQFKYTLDNGDILYLPPIAHAEIQSLNPAAREPFTLTKSIAQGNQAVWKVERIQPSAPVENKLPKRPALAASESTTVTPKPITNGVKAVSVMPTPEPLSTRQSKAMARQLIAAIDAGIAAVAYAKSQNFPLELTSRDICAIAISGSIQQFREGVY
jgi:hypothetical protein